MSATEAIGEAAFYGPKIDFTVKDVLGRSWQLGTVQVDYNLPQRFALQYIGADNRPHVPVMIHRAPFGSLERFCGLLIEHFGGDFPLWLAPEQVRILTVGDAFVPYAKEVYDRLKEKKIRVYWDDRSEKLGTKIRRAEEDKIPYVLVLGEKEEKENTVAIRSRIQPQNNGSLPINDALELLQAEIVERRLPTQRTRESLGEVR
jgi:threonyl-tRNA synthetase